MTKLYKNTGIEYEIEYPPPPEPPPPAPDPDSPSPPGDNVDSDSPSGDEPVDKSTNYSFKTCWIREGEYLFRGTRIYANGTPIGPCVKSPGQDPPDSEGGVV